MKLKLKMKIHQEGRNILISLFIILLLLNIPIYLWLDVKWLAYLIYGVSIISFLLVANFFRSPQRHFKGNPKNAVVAPADGVIVVAEEVLEDEYFHEKRMQVSIFMNIFNVHANWFPVTGQVLHVGHQRGRFMAAYLPKSSTENERSTVVIKAENGQEILVRQIAGAMARRIVTYAEKGDRCHVDEHMGFIKFGSRVDVYLPLDCELKVALHDKTIGNLTEIAHLK